MCVCVSVCLCMSVCVSVCVEDKERDKEGEEKAKKGAFVQVHVNQISGTRVLSKEATGGSGAKVGPMPTSFQKTFRLMLSCLRWERACTCASGVATGSTSFSSFIDDTTLPRPTLSCGHSTHTPLFASWSL